ncbi:MULTISPECIES: DUF721 domain-containing protein [Lysobacter]|jgi:hypothetical protein|uniref:DUF721 domain-containing protein n=1 Tax=Lysobacter soli TaxID=453783 RepID=A0A3D8VHW8_9GAMM|nr:DUF721 domain-containing protein [Lysobacter soli]MDG2516881.1 DUF721 domain-containing protein [Lysobacter soli]RDY68909.1 DUF721 domain-containing protein [Lysobacter soli]UTA54107.1 DUF721 domain-containing protein [Lysobacter soli]
MSSSDSKPRSRKGGPSTPRAALDALLAEPAGGPVRRALWLDELDQRFRPLLPPSLAAHARLANYERGRLVFVVDAPVWRAKMRLAAPELLDAARSIGLDAAELIVKTTTPVIASPQSDRKAKPISATALQALQAALESLKEPGSTGSSDST